MESSGDFNSSPELDYERFIDVVRSLCGRYTPGGIGPETFGGTARAGSICGLVTVSLSCNAPRVERTHRDFRSDGMEHYYAIFQMAGQSTVVQNDHTVELTVGDVALVDAARPVTYVSEKRNGHWLSLQLPRQSLISHLGFEPEGGLRRHGETLAARLCFRLLQDAVNERGSSPASAEPYMQLAIYDLLGALFAASDLPTISSHTDKLFKRVCDIIKDRFAEPDFGPSEVAAEAGISLRYLQKLFTARGSTCTDFIHSVRLDHAARQLHRRGLLNTSQPISEIAYASGFTNYTHFARQFRRRFGHPPVAHAGDHDQARALPYR
jgi:AraC family transcriptional regulator, positive regulator of tynA and feaB